MSKTVSFVARDELAEWLESRADVEMKTVSSVVQDIVAEQYHQEVGREKAQEMGLESGDEPAGEVEDDDPGDAVDRHPDRWYQPDSEKHDYAVAVPEDEDTYDAGGQRYYKTRRGASEALKRWYE